VCVCVRACVRACFFAVPFRQIIAISLEEGSDHHEASFLNTCLLLTLSGPSHICTCQAVNTAGTCFVLLFSCYLITLTQLKFLHHCRCFKF